MSIWVPTKVLHEAEGHILTCETDTGEVYRGKPIEAEDSMNCQMFNTRHGQLEQVIGDLGEQGGYMCTS
ncbi:hypothetical protein STEG23_036353 [Scotinomys teguina]